MVHFLLLSKDFLNVCTCVCLHMYLYTVLTFINCQFVQIILFLLPKISDLKHDIMTFCCGLACKLLSSEKHAIHHPLRLFITLGFWMCFSFEFIYGFKCVGLLIHHVFLPFAINYLDFVILFISELAKLNIRVFYCVP